MLQMTPWIQSLKHYLKVWFNIEMYLRFNLGPLHLSDGLINEILAFDANKTYLRVGTDPNRLTTKNVYKSSGVGGFEKRDETKSRLPESFWSPTSSSSKWIIHAKTVCWECSRMIKAIKYDQKTLSTIINNWKYKKLPLRIVRGARKKNWKRWSFS